MEHKSRTWRRIQLCKAAYCGFLLCLLCLLVPSDLRAAISLQTPSTDVVIVIEPLPFNTLDASLLIPICDVSLVAKHPGFGRVYIEHTPLSSPLEMVMYQLVSENGLDFERSEPFLYYVQGALHEEVSIGRLWARLIKPFKGDAQQYSSTLRLNLVLEK